MSDSEKVNSAARGRACVFLAAVLAVGVSAMGCRLPQSPPTIAQGLQSPDPDERIQAVIRAGRMRDKLVLPLLVERLEDRDEAVRMFAIEAMERITGTRRGYEYYASSDERAAAVARWRQWLRQQASGEGGP